MRWKSIRNRKGVPIASIGVLVLAVGCGHGLSGKYTTNGSSPMSMTFEFQSGDKVLVTAMGTASGGTYKLDGDNVSVYCNGKNLTLKRKDGDHSLEGPMGMTFLKD